VKAHIQIPNGWRRLKPGSRCMYMDRYLHWGNMEFKRLPMFYRPHPVASGEFIIRRIKTKKGKES
jgi:hypothetical protein